MCELPAVTVSEVLRNCIVYTRLLQVGGNQHVSHPTVPTALTARFWIQTNKLLDASTGLRERHESTRLARGLPVYREKPMLLSSTMEKLGELP
jgi:hypothetical protein